MQGESEPDDAVLQQLDEKITKYMALVETLLQLRESLSQIMKTGFFDLSKAKYTMGTTTVSPLAYPHRMCANTFLKTTQDSPSKPFHFSLSLAKFTTTTGENGNDNTTVRRRRNSQDGGSANTTPTTMTATQVVKYGSGDIDDEEDTGGIQRDPLLWFGVLVSPHLRQSQKDFQKAQVEERMLPFCRCPPKSERICATCIFLDRRCLRLKQIDAPVRREMLTIRQMRVVWAPMHLISASRTKRGVSALGLVVEIANITQQLELLQQEYFKLLQTKSATKPIL